MLVAAVVLASIVWVLVEVGQLNVFTGLVFLAAVWLFVLWITDRASGVLRQSAGARNRVRLVVASTAVATVLLELFLRFGLQEYSTYPERNGSWNYRPSSSSATATWFHVHPSHRQLRSSNKELAYERTTNALGLSEREIPQAKAPGEFRIIALGDSFTEGLGVGADATWVKVLERLLSEKFPRRNVVAFNAGVAGSDVCFEYMLLREKLLPFSPDLVIVAINRTDVQDLINRGGMERFRPDGTTQAGRAPPSWEWMYGISYVFRHAAHDGFGVNRMLLSPREADAAERTAIDQIRAAIEQLNALADARGFALVVAFHPTSDEFAAGEYHPKSLDRLASDLRASNSAGTIDLLRLFIERRMITAATASTFYWPIDLHHNVRGYEAMGVALADAIAERHLVDSPASSRD